MLKQNIMRKIKWSALSAMIGVLAGLSSGVFLISLNWVTDLRTQHTQIILLLPIAGLFIGWAYHKYGSAFQGGNNLVIDEIHDPKKTLPIQMAPFVLFGTLITHLFGGSAGREGTAVQMGASLAHQLSKIFKIEKDEGRILLVAGAGAGFGAAIGAPWAGVIFGMEVIYIGRLRLFAWLECFIASFVAYYTALFIGAKHSVFPSVEIPLFSWTIFLSVILSGIIFGLVGIAFIKVTHFIENQNRRFISYPPLKPFIAGLILVALFWLEGSFRYAGLGIPVIQDALIHPASIKDPVLKLIFTAITVGSGFKGGEFIPLVFIGTTLGSALSFILPISFSLLAALGFAAVFAGATNTPIACSIMAIEIFGPQIAPYAFIACFVAYYCSGHKGIYSAQRISHKKHHDLNYFLNLLGELPKRFNRN